MGIIKYIGSQFAVPSGIFGKTTAFLMNRINKKQYSTVLNLLTERSAGTKILDIGFGNGYMLKKLTNYDCKLYGTDISPDMVKLSEKKLKKYDIQLKCGGIEELGFDDDFFETTYTINTIYFWPSLNSGLKQVYRTLKKNGIFINAMYTKDWLNKTSFTEYGYKKYDIEEIEKEARSAGFRDIEVKEIEKNKSLVIVMKK